MRIYTVFDRHADPGVVVTSRDIAGRKLSVLTLGEEGRGRRLLLIRVEPPVAPGARVMAGEIERTPTGALVLTHGPVPEAPGPALVVFRATPGYRGTLAYTGDGADTPFPGEVLGYGVVAEGIAGRVCAGEQMLAIVPPATTFSIRRTGRLYGAPPIVVYRYTGTALLGPVTPEERALLGEW